MPAIVSPDRVYLSLAHEHKYSPFPLRLHLGIARDTHISIPGSIELAIARARVLKQMVCHCAAVGRFSPTGQVKVQTKFTLDVAA